MNQATQTEKPAAGGRRFVLEMLGFSDAEKTMLTSTFRLTGRREFCYAEPASADDRSDIYLVNADDPGALAQLQMRSPNIHAPAVLIGRTPVALGWPMVGKPIHWMRLFNHRPA